MSLRRLPAALALAAALLAPAAARADVPWSPPVALPNGSGANVAPIGAITPDGHVGSVSVNVSGASPTQLDRLTDAGAPIASDGLGLADPHTAAAGRDTLVIAGSSLGKTGTIDDTSHIRVATAAGAGGPITTTPISGTTGLGVRAVAANAAGDVVLVAANTQKRVVYLKQRDWQQFHAKLTITVNPSTARNATVAIGAKGDVLVVWESDHTVFARHRGTSSWGAVATLGAGIQSDLSAVVDGSNRLSAAWKSQRVGEGESNTPAIVSFITAQPGHSWGSRRQIESVATASGAGHYVASPGVELDAVDDHHLLLTWTGISSSRYAVKAMTLTDGHTAAPSVLTPAGTDAVLGDATAGPGGTALVLWRSGVEGSDPVDAATRPRLFASTRSAGATAFAAPEAISAVADDVLQPPTALLSPASRAATALYAILPGGARLSVRSPIAP